MTAVDYYHYYGKPIMEEIATHPGEHEKIQAFLNAFTKESIEIMQSRRIVRDRGVVAVLKQQNRKWNDFCHLVEQNYGYTPIKRNAYWKIMKREIPGLEEAEQDCIAAKGANAVV